MSGVVTERSELFAALSPTVPHALPRAGARVAAMAFRCAPIWSCAFGRAALDRDGSRCLLHGRKGFEMQLKFDDRGLIPAVVQQYDTGEVLMVAWMNAESLRLTQETKTTWFWSRSRQELWNKGATSGNMQRVISVDADCDADTLLVRVDSPGPACHTGARSCFFNRIYDAPEGATKED